MADRPRHPNKEIEAAVAYGEGQGWTWFKVQGHAWGKLYCPHKDRDGCIVFVWSTPRVPERHAKQITRDFDRCPHKEGNVALTRKEIMRAFEFSIIASGLNPEAEGFADRFFNAGCDDATISFQKGHIILDFARDAASIDEAICTAVECAQKAGAHVDRIEPDPFVSLADIAARTGLSRAAISQYAKGQRSAGFPSPVARVTSDASLYDWSQVAAWLYRHDKLSRDQAIEAAAVRAANDAISANEPKLRKTLQERLKRYEATLEAA